MNRKYPRNHHACLEIDDIEQGEPEVDSLLGDESSRDLGSPEEEHSLDQGAGHQLSYCSSTDEVQLYQSANELVRVSESFIAEQESLETQRKLNTRLLTAIDDDKSVEELQKLLDEGADPNATCHDGKLSACHLAALTGGDVLSLLMKNNAEIHRVDDLGRTPLHMAALTGKVRDIALLLDFPEDMLNRIENGNVSSEELKEYSERNGDLMNIYWNSIKKSVPSSWMDHRDHDCKKMDWTVLAYLDLSENWTPLHAVSALMHKKLVQLFLAAGADPNFCDGMGRTALDVAGLLESDTTHFFEVIELIINAGGKYNTMKAGGVNEVLTPLHSAVWLDNRKIIEILLENGASVACWDKQGNTPLHVCVRLRRQEIFEILVNISPDVQDRDGKTALRAAVDARWHPGVRKALKAGADVTIQATDGETPLHVAVAIGESIHHILNFAEQEKVIDCLNSKGETPLFNAVNIGHVTPVIDGLLFCGASIKHTSKNNMNVFHVAAKNGSENVLKKLLNYGKDCREAMINCLTKWEGCGPIHFAVSRNHLSCVKLLIENNADVCLKTSSSQGSITPLHIAAVNDNAEIAEYILSCGLMSPTHSGAQQHSAPRPMDQVDGEGWLPLHYAINNDSKEVIKLLLRRDPNLAAQAPKDIDGSENSETVLDMIMNNVSKPTEFLESILNSYISLDGKMNKVKIDYQILMPEQDQMKQMSVIEALLKTGTEYEQRRLLLHPLIESYINIKWQTAKPYYFLIAGIYTCFVVSLTGFAVSFFYNKDINQTKPEWSNFLAGGCVTYFFILLIILLELLMHRSFLKPKNWVKLASLGSAIILPSAIMVQEEAARHVATGALFLAYAQVLIILSHFPNWGYNVVMFGKVALNLVKILGTFVVLLIAFALSFMILFRSQPPFNGPWEAFVKTLFLWSSEFGYDDLFNAKHKEDLGFSLEIFRVMFIAFLILVPIALMNMVVCVAIDDIADLKSYCQIRSLEKQVAFMSSVGPLFEFNLKQKVISCLPVGYCREIVSRNILLEGDTVKLKTVYNIREMPKRFWQAFYSIAQEPKIS